MRRDQVVQQAKTNFHGNGRMYVTKAYREEFLGALPVGVEGMGGHDVDYEEGALGDEVGADAHVLNGLPEYHRHHGIQPHALLQHDIPCMCCTHEALIVSWCSHKVIVHSATFHHMLHRQAVALQACTLHPLRRVCHCIARVPYLCSSKWHVACNLGISGEQRTHGKGQDIGTERER